MSTCVVSAINMSIRKGSKVSWKYSKGTGTGKVIEKFESKVTRTIKGKKITRNATPEDPVYLIEQENGDRVLKFKHNLKKK